MDNKDSQGGGRGTAATQKRVPTPWNEIKQEGTYVDVESGELYQISEDAFVEGHRSDPVLAIKRFSTTTPMVVLLSADPKINVHDARTIAKELNLKVDF